MRIATPTAIVILVFLPILFLDGVSGAFFRPLALAYVLAVFASMLVAVTLIWFIPDQRIEKALRA